MERSEGRGRQSRKQASGSAWSEKKTRLSSVRGRGRYRHHRQAASPRCRRRRRRCRRSSCGCSSRPPWSRGRTEKQEAPGRRGSTTPAAARVRSGLRRHDRVLRPLPGEQPGAELNGAHDGGPPHSPRKPGAEPGPRPTRGVRALASGPRSPLLLSL